VGWERDPDLLGVGDPAELMASAYPAAGPSVWKDPRVCLLLPYWRDRFPTPFAAVLVGRSPMAVARSLQQRDGMTIVDGLALWERYSRSAVEGLAGIDTYVVDYETVIDDPGGFVGQLVGWLGSLDQFNTDEVKWDLDGAVASITGELRHQPSGRSEDDDALLLPEQWELASYLTGLQGAHRPLAPPPAMVESAWTTDVIRLRRNKFPADQADRAPR